MKDEDILKNYYIENNCLPTYEEMKSLFGVASKNTVSYRVNKMLKEGFLVKEGSRLSLSSIGTIIKLGSIQAGFPTAVEEEVSSELMSLDDFLIDRKKSTYMLEVMGESMIDAGILEGDLVLVERNKVPRNGDIVVALVEHEYTLKYLGTEKGKPVLIPANKKFKKIYPDPITFKIEAVLKAVIRKYR